jgi:hypothetical protein
LAEGTNGNLRGDHAEEGAMTGAHAHADSRWERTKWQIREALGIAPEDQDLETDWTWDPAEVSVEGVAMQWVNATTAGERGSSSP